MALAPPAHALDGPALQAPATTERTVSNGPLHGTLVLPADGERTAAALILAGSGPVDRDGNLPHARNDSLKALAHGLAAQGIATLRVDKRGIGASAGAASREEALRFDTYVDDAVSWLRTLDGVLAAEAGAASPEVRRLFLIGHSEGALVATRAAQRHAVAGLVLLAGAGEPAGAVIDRQLAAAAVPDSLRAQSRRIVAALERQAPVADVPEELRALYRPSVQPYLMSWLPLDPAAELAKVQAPVLIVQGTTDLQISTGDAERLAAARPDTRLVIVAGMNHVLKPAPVERGANLATYATPDLPLAPRLIPAIADFMVRR
ncbi:alpha/beta fold hydrolase [Xanthobacter sp. V4C-4]|uniref:alpha/beta hydrolase n=1 Tax=Xanthobacter cornucopiae TaxID=3119924 RepID=UPI0037282D2F